MTKNTKIECVYNAWTRLGTAGRTRPKTDGVTCLGCLLGRGMPSGGCVVCLTAVSGRRRELALLPAAGW